MHASTARRAAAFAALLLAFAGCQPLSPDRAPPADPAPLTATGQSDGEPEIARDDHVLPVPEPDDRGVYRFLVGGRITEPRVIKRGEFDDQLLVGRYGPPVSLVAEMTIDMDGSVRDLVLLHGFEPAIDAAFLDMVRGYLFEPATLDGQPVPVRHILVLRIDVF